jgi:DNA repair photolyase
VSGAPETPGRSHGRGTNINPPNRFERISIAPRGPDEPADTFDTVDTVDPVDPSLERPVPTVFFRDASRSVLARNDSPDIPFTYSLNPYRGCEHGCAYCYARPSHEYLGFSAGLDFETKILVKEDAPELLRREMSRASWTPQMVALCGNTDPYQPVERRLRITRGCLEVFLDLRNPVGVITKNSLILRDLDLIASLASMRLAAVTLSITTLRADFARKLEPRTSSPEKRFDAVEKLAAAGVPVSVFIAPVIPGLNDHEIPAILAEAASRGATRASCTMLRLPGPVEPIFLEWLKREVPEAAKKVEGRLREARGGKLNDARFGKRMSGEGEAAAAIHSLFRITAARLGLDREGPGFDTTLFRRREPGQGELFG